VTEAKDGAGWAKGTDSGAGWGKGTVSAPDKGQSSSWGGSAADGMELSSCPLDYITILLILRCFQMKKILWTCKILMRIRNRISDFFYNKA
jgi:hypothetical protein